MCTGSQHERFVSVTRSHERRGFTQTEFWLVVVWLRSSRRKIYKVMTVCCCCHYSRYSRSKFPTWTQHTRQRQTTRQRRESEGKVKDPFEQGWTRASVPLRPSTWPSSWVFTDFYVIPNRRVKPVAYQSSKLCDRKNSGSKNECNRRMVYLSL